MIDDIDTRTGLHQVVNIAKVSLEKTEGWVGGGLRGRKNIKAANLITLS